MEATGPKVLFDSGMTVPGRPGVQDSVLTTWHPSAVRPGDSAVQTGNYSPLNFAIGTQNAVLQQKVVICTQNTTAAADAGGALSCRLPFASLLRPFLPMHGIHITDIEAAINHWRQRHPCPDGVRLSPEVRALAPVYARLIHAGAQEVNPASLSAAAMQAWLGWYETQPDTPCIAICSTSQGDAQCKGCGRSFGEVQQWLELSPVHKRAVWRRIVAEGTALRFTRYAERAK